MCMYMKANPFNMKNLFLEVLVGFVTSFAPVISNPLKKAFKITYDPQISIIRPQLKQKILKIFYHLKEFCRVTQLGSWARIFKRLFSKRLWVKKRL